jgi:hypothetical protein
MVRAPERSTQNATTQRSTHDAPDPSENGFTNHLTQNKVENWQWHQSSRIHLLLLLLSALVGKAPIDALKQSSHLGRFRKSRLLI